MIYPLALESLAFNLKAGIATMIEGPPGNGKTAMVGHAARAAGRGLVTDTLSTMESVDLRGLPMTVDGAVKWSRPEFLARLHAAGPAPVLFIDEANAVGQSLQVPLMQMVYAGRVGPHDLPAGTTVVLAGNRQKDRAAAQRMGTALNDRLSILEVETHLPTWLAWAASVDLHPLLCAFLMLRGEGTHGRPGLLHNFDPTKPDVKNFPSPRSWEIAAPYCDAPDHLRMGLFASKVGEAAASEIEGFRRVWLSLPPIPVILADPDNAALPTDPSVQWAVAVALSRASNGASFGNALRYMARVGREFQTVMATDAVRRKPELANTTPYIHWAAANADVAI